MVLTWRMMRGAVFVSALVISVELVQACIGAVAFFSAPAAQQRYRCNTRTRTVIAICSQFNNTIGDPPSILSA